MTSMTNIRIDAKAREDASSAARCACCRRRMERPKARRLTILDGIVLVGATGVALAISRGAWQGTASVWLNVLGLTPALLTCATLAALALRLRQPRPTLPRLTRQPGAVALLAASAILMVGALPIAVTAIVRLVRMGSGSTPMPVYVAPGIQPGGVDWATWLGGPLFHLTGVIGPAVVGAWVVLALSGRRRPESSWIDRFGRLLGSLWIAAFVVHLFFDLITRFHRY